MVRARDVGEVVTIVWVFCTRGFQPFVVTKTPSDVERKMRTSGQNHSMQRPAKWGHFVAEKLCAGLFYTQRPLVTGA
jgi:hypothetical protein